MSLLIPNSPSSLYISTKEASDRSGYNPDYLSRLCRTGVLKGKQVGRAWLIEQESLDAFCKKQVLRKEALRSFVAHEREKEYRNARLSDEVLANITRHTVSKHKPSLKVAYNRPLAAAAVALFVVTGVAYGSTSPYMLGAVGSVPHYTERLAQTFAPQVVLPPSEFRIRPESHSERIFLTNAYQVAPPEIPLTLPPAEHVAREFAFATGAQTNTYMQQWISYGRTATHETPLAAVGAQRVEVFATAVTQPREVLRSVVRGYVHIGESVFAAMHSANDGYTGFVFDTGNSAITGALAVRDSSATVAIGPHNILGAYEQSLNSFAVTAPIAAEAIFATIVNLGDSIARATSNAPATVVATKDAAIAPLSATVIAAADRVVGGPIAIAPPTRSDSLEATLLGVAGNITSRFDGEDTQTASVVGAVPSSWQRGIAVLLEGVGRTVEAFVHAGIRSIASTFGIPGFAPELAIIPFSENEIIVLPSPSDADTWQFGYGVYGTTGAGTQSIMGTGVMQNIIQQYFPQTIIAGPTDDYIRSLVAPMIGRSIENADRGDRGGGTGDVSSNGATLTNVTISSGNATLSTADIASSTLGTSTIANLTVGTGTVTGNLSIGGTLTAGTLSVSGISSAGAIAAPYFTATSTTATSTFPNLDATNISVTNLTATSAQLTNATSTNFFASVLDATLGEFVTLLATNALLDNATTTNATSTNLFATTARLITAVIDTLTATTGTITNLTSTIANLATATITNLTATNATITALTGTNVTYTNATTTNATSTISYTSTLGLGSNYFTSLLGNGLINSGGVLAVSTSSLASGFFQQNGNAFGGLATLGTTDNQPLRFITNNSEAVRILADGNVGIGTNAPAAKLDVQGGAIIGAGDKSNGAWPLYISDSSDLGWKVADSAGTAKFELYAGFGGTNEMRLLNGVSLIGHGQNLVLGTDGATTAVTVANSTGNLGVGTSSPSARLSVGGTSLLGGDTYIGGNLTTTATATVTNLSIGSLTGFLRATAGAVSTGLVSLSSDISGTLGIANGGTGLGTAPTFGQLLVGTASGTYALTSTSSLGYRTTDVAEGTNLYFTDARARTAVSSAYTTGGVAFGNGTNLSVDENNFFWDNTAKRLGLGTTSPSQTLSVGGNALISGTLTLGTPLAQTSGGTGFATYDPGDILYADNSGILQRLPIGSSGQVLKVTGGIPFWGADQITGGGGGETAWATTTDSLAIYPSDTSDVLIIGNSSTTTASSIFEVFGMSYFSNTVGIGTTSPSLLSRLAVQGSGLFSGNLSAANITATGTITGLNALFTNATTTRLGINSETFTDLTGSGLLNVSGALTLDRTGDWTGTFEGQEGTWYRDRANHTGTQLASTISDFTSAARGVLSGSYPVQYNSGSGAISLAFGTTTSNTWAGTQTFSTLTGTTATFTNATATTLGIGALTGPLQAINGSVSATSTLSIAYGGTGLSTAPTFGQLLVGNSSGGYTLTSTSSLGIVSGVSSVFGRTGAVIAQSGDYSTTLVTEGTNLYFTDARARSALSESITGIDYTSGTGVFSLTSGYEIPLTASTTDWNSFYNTPSTRITAGTNLFWTGNTLSVSTTSLNIAITDTTGTLPINRGGTNATAQTTNGVNFFNGTSITSSADFTYNGTNLSVAGGSIIAGSQFVAPIGSAGTPGYAFATDLATGFFRPALGIIAFSNDGVEGMRLNNSNNLGIGTTSPSERLSVQGNALISGNLSIGSLSGLLQASSGAVSAVTGTAGQFPVFSGTNTVAATSSIFLATSGNVGIGLTSPATPLEVALSTSGSPGIRASRAGAPTQYIQMDIGGGAAGRIFATGSDKQLSIINNNSNAGSGTTLDSMVFQVPGPVAGTPITALYLQSSNGFTGLGTTTPSQRLSVQGNALISGNITSVANITATGTITTPNLTIGSLNGLLNATNGVVGTIATSSLNIAITDTTGTLPINRGGTNATAQTTNGINYFDGTSITSSSNLTYNGTNLVLTGGSISAGTQFIAPVGSAGTPSYSFATDLTTGLFRPTSGAIALSSAGSEVARFTSSGLGIGTTGPAYRFTLKQSSQTANGALRVEDSASALGINLFHGNSGIQFLAFEDSFQIGNQISTSESGTVQAGRGLILKTWDNASAGFISFDVNGTEIARFGRTGNLGIGTTTPAERLSVQGNALISGNITSVANITATGTITTPNLTIGSLSGLLQASSGAVSAVTGTAGQFPVFSGTNTVTATSSIFLATNGSVGIGTTSPSEAFSVSSRTYLAGPVGIGVLPEGGGSALTIENNLGTLKFVTSDSNESFIGIPSALFTGGGSGLGIRTVSGPIVLSTNNTLTSGVFIDTVGNIGLGTTTPSQRLSVQGNALISGNITSVANITATGTITTPNLTIGSLNGLLNATNGVVGTIATSSLNIAITDTTGTLPINRGGTNATAQTTNGINYFDGTSITSSSNLTYNGTNLVLTGGSISAGTQFIAPVGSAGTPSYSFATDLTTGLFRPAASTIAFSTGGTERMRIDSAGNVGIGTTTTTGRRLTISGDTNALSTLALENTNTGASARNSIVFINNSGGIRQQIWAYSTTNTDTPDGLGLYADGYVFNTVSGVERMRLTSAGNLGIGTTSPQARLHVSGGNILLDNDRALQQYDSSGVARNLITTATDNSVSYNGFQGTPMINGVNGATYLYGSGSGGIAMTILSSGSVGIGTTTPMRALSIGAGQLVVPAGSASAPGYSFASSTNTGISLVPVSQTINISTNGTTRLDISSTGVNSSVAFTGTQIYASLNGDQTNPAFNFGTVGDSGFFYNSGLRTTVGGTERMIVNTSGNVGIGTSNPVTRLDVQGTASSTRSFAGIGTVSLPGFAFSTDQDTGIYSATADTLSISTAGGQRAEFGTSTTRFFGINMALGGTPIDTNIALTTAGNVTNPAAEQIGANFSRTLVLTSANSNTVSGGIFNVSTQANAFNATGILRGGRLSIQNSNTATVSRAFGGDSLVYNVGTGTITDAAGYNATFQNLVAGGTITNAYGYRVQSFPFNNGTIANTYGVFVDDITVGTQTNTPYSFYANDPNAWNYFAGRTGIASTTPWGLLSVNPNAIGANPAFVVGSSTATRFIITNTGDVGIGTSSPTAQLHTTGTVRFSNFGAGTLTTDASGNVTASSDERLKNVNGAYERGLSAIMALDPILYHWNAQSGLDRSTQYAGFSAQNVQRAIPEAIDTDPRGMLTLSDRPILAASVNAIKELAGRTDQLSIATSSLAVRLGAVESSWQSFIASSTLPQALTATAITAQTLSIAEGVSAGTLTSQTVTAEGTIAAARYVVPQSAVVFTVGSTTITASTPSEALTASGSVDLYRLASYGVAVTESLRERVDGITLALTSLESRIGALEANATSTSGTLDGAVGLTVSSVQSALRTIGVTISNGIARLTALVTTQLVFTDDADGNSSVGVATIPAGQTEVEVINPLVLPSSKVFITFTGSIDGAWHLAERSNGRFTVRLAQAQSADLSFDYFILQTGGQVASAGAVVTPSSESGVGQQNALTSPSAPIVAGGPTVTLIGEAAVQFPQGAQWEDPGATAQAADGTNLTSSIAVSGGVDVSTPGLYTVTYRVTDAEGRAGEASRIVTVLAPSMLPENAPQVASPEPTPEPSVEEVAGDPAPTASTETVPQPSA